MSNGDRQSLSSAFDDMLKQTWRELDGLYDGPITAPAGGERPAAPSSRPSHSLSPASRSGANLPDAERFLNDRYGDGWRQEVLERKRDGDEVVVLCKLVIEDQDISKTHFGSARLPGAAPSAGVAGRSAGVGFALGQRQGDARTPGEDPETTAFRAAAADALAKCVAML